MRLGASGVGDRAGNALLLFWRRASRVAPAKLPHSCAAAGRRTTAGEEQSRCGNRYLRRVMSELLLDAAGRRRSPATMPEFHAGRPPRNKGIRYPADLPTIE